jgi:predicted alpha/beta-fold hydrolase
MTVFWSTLVLNFFIALGIIVGASIFAVFAAMISNHPPIKTMVSVANSLKIWAVAVALGGTFQSIEVLEQGILRGEIKSIAKELIYIISALAGANAGFSFIMLIKRCAQIWGE